MNTHVHNVRKTFFNILMLWIYALMLAQMNDFCKHIFNDLGNQWFRKYYFNEIHSNSFITLIQSRPLKTDDSIILAECIRKCSFFKNILYFSLIHALFFTQFEIHLVKKHLLHTNFKFSFHWMNQLINCYRNKSFNYYLFIQQQK